MKNFKIKSLPYLLVLPGVIILIVFIAYPLIQSLINVFFEWDGSLFTEKIFVGFANFSEMFNSQLFLVAMKNTFIFSLIMVSGTVILGFILAAIINKKIMGWQFYRFAFFVTVALSSVVIGLLWFKIYDPVNGLLNNFLELLHLDSWQQAWLGDVKFALASISVVTVWQYSGLTMVWFIAAIKTIPQDIYDAAKIDGANYIQYVFYIIIPAIKQVIFIVTMIMLISSFRIFDLIWVMTRGGPVDSTQVLSSAIYINLFQFRTVGPASAISIVTLIFGLIFSLLYLRLTASSEKS